MKNEGDRSLDSPREHVSLVDADGRSVPAVVNRPIQWKRPENHLFEPGDSPECARSRSSHSPWR